MPVEILIPPALSPAAPLGPGMAAQWQFTGPIPTGWQWEYRITDDSDETQTVVSSLFPATQNTVAVGIGEPYTLSTLLTGKYQVPHGSPALLTVRLFDDQLTLREIGNRAITYDAISGMPHVVAASQVAPVSGYAQADRDRDIKTSAAVLSAFPLTTAIGELVEVGLDAQFGCPPLPLLVPSSALLLTGSGTVDRPSGSTGVHAYGFVFRLEIVPPGLSVIDGRSLEFPERLAQFLVIRVDANGNEYVADRYEFHHDQERICWGIPFPKRLEYSILPGVSLRFFWLLFPVGQ